MIQSMGVAVTAQKQISSNPDKIHGDT